MGTSSQLPTNDAQKATASQGVDIVSELMRRRNESADQASQLAKTASVPVAVGHQKPSILDMNQSHFTPLALDTSYKVGAGNVKQQGIANLVTSAANLVGSMTAQHMERKQKSLAVDIERVMQATDAMDQAQQVLKQDPNSPEAKEVLDKNTKIVDGILNDEKKRKQFEKAFKINMTDPAKNNTPEHGALKQASDSYAQQFQKQRPNQMGPNTQAIAQAQQAQATTEGIDKAIKAITPFITAQEKIKEADVISQRQLEGKELEVQGKMNVEKSKESYAGQLEHQKAQDEFQKATTVANINGHYHLAGIAAAQNHADQRFHEGLDAKIKQAGGKLGGMATKDLMTSLKEAEEIIKTGPDTVTKLTTVRDMWQKKSEKDPNAKKSLDWANQSLYYEQQQQKANGATAKALREEINKRTGINGNASDNSPEATSTGVSSAISNGTSAEDDVGDFIKWLGTTEQPDPDD